MRWVEGECEGNSPSNQVGDELEFACLMHFSINESFVLSLALLVPRQSLDAFIFVLLRV